MANLLNYLVPQDMEQYLSYYGMHFNKLLCEFAVGKMKRDDKATGVLKKITPMTLEELKALFYNRIKAIHIQRYPYNDFLFQQYE